MAKLSLTDPCIAKLLEKGVDKQTRIFGEKGLFISIGKRGTAVFFLRYTDKRIGKQKDLELPAWDPKLFDCGKAGVRAAIERDKIARDIYPSKGEQLPVGAGIAFPELVVAYIDDCQTIVNKPVKNRPGETYRQVKIKTWPLIASYLNRAAARLQGRLAAAVDDDDITLVVGSVEGPSAANRMRQSMQALCKWGNTTINPATDKRYIKADWFATYMVPAKKEARVKKRIKAADDIREFWETLREDEGCPGSIASRRALALTLCTALRSGQCAKLRRHNVVGINGANPRLYIHPEDVKQGRYMVVPLNSFGVEIIQEALADAGPELNAPLFPGCTGVEPILQSSLSKIMNGDNTDTVGIMEYMGWKGTPKQVGPHALRRTSASLVSNKGKGYSLADIALLLDHQKDGGDEEGGSHKVTAGYAIDFTIEDDQGDDMHEKRVELAKALEAALRAVLDPQPANVVPLRAA
jgi:integrase